MNQHDQEILKAAEEIRYRERAMAGQLMGAEAPQRERTVREHLSEQRNKLKRQMEALSDLSDNLPASYLESPYSRLGNLSPNT